MSSTEMTLLDFGLSFVLTFVTGAVSIANTSSISSNVISLAGST